MNRKRQVREGGFSPVFVIVTIVLVITLAGGLYWAKQRGDQALQEEAQIAAESESAATENNQKSSNSESAASDEEEKSESSQNGTASDSEAVGSADEQLPESGASLNISLMLLSSISTYVAVYYAQSTRRRQVVREL